MQALCHREAAIRIECFGKHRAEGGSLRLGGHTKHLSEDRTRQILVRIRETFGIKERIVDIRGATVKAGEQKSQLGSSHRRGAVLMAERLLLRRVGQRGFGGLYGANRAHEVGKHLGGVLLPKPVTRAVGDVIFVAGEQDQIAVVALVRLGNAAEQGVHRLGVRKLGRAQARKQGVLGSTVGDLSVKNGTLVSSEASTLFDMQAGSLALGNVDAVNTALPQDSDVSVISASLYSGSLAVFTPQISTLFIFHTIPVP